MSSLKTWIWFSLCGGNSSGKTRALLHHFGSVERIYAADEHAYREIDVLSRYDLHHLMNKNTDKAERIIDDCAKKGIRIITMQDVAYPDRLKQISMPPPVLYMRGVEIDIDDEVAIAMVGTRDATSYGLRASEKIAGEIASGGGLIVSGLARGIDATAHRAALNAGGKTIAVLGCGVDVCYPRENKKLFESIICDGMVISEFPPGTEPHRSNFPRRNRVISGISVGTVVVEAPRKSGALITAGLAVEQDRDVFAVVGSIFSPSSEGPNKLICEGARPVISGRDVLLEYEFAFPHRIKMSEIGRSSINEKEEIKNDTPPRVLSKEFLLKFSDDERQIISAIGSQALRADEISQRCGFAPQKVLSLLTLLEISGHVTQQAGSLFSLKEDL